MKILLIAFIVCSALSPCIAQHLSNDTFYLSKIPTEGILLDKGWKFHVGDDTAWAKLNYDDHNWDSINPTLDIRHIPQVQNISFYWLRLKLRVDSSLLDQPEGIYLSQVGASEIHLNGRLLYKLGTIDFKNKQISTHFLLHKPFVIKLDNKTEQVLAIRYAYDPKSFLIKYGNPNFFFNALLNTVSKTFSIYREEDYRSSIYEIGIMSVWIILSIVSFCFYFLYSNKKAYKYIGIVGLLMFVSHFYEAVVIEMLFKTSSVSIRIFISLILQVLAGLFGVYGFYLLVGEKKTRFYYVLVTYSLLLVFSSILLYDLVTLLYVIYFTLTSIEQLRTGFRAFRNNRPGATILIYTFLMWLFCDVLGFIAVATNSLNIAYFVSFITTIIPAIGFSVFIAYEFAHTGLALQARVKEVEELSEEKHHILSEQNLVLEKQVEQRTSQLQNSLTELKSTQAQLIQSEKMASLGELTAGIAHEIQNPLNFVNNFSEVNRELIEELKSQKEKLKNEEQDELLNNIDANLEKVLQHGKRADAIVKGMLQHSRSSAGVKEPTDINKLADEYLRLAYHGFRAKEKDFNAKFETDFDNNIDKINIIPQDIGRVLLNLINNAFYAVNEKQKQLAKEVTPLGKVSPLWQPVVQVSTKKLGNRIYITVSDNGNGISKSNIDKIFQPFFTTKPTGQGTGLGLSLSYDIIKAHGGEIKAETEEGEGTTFIISLPV